MCNRKLRVLVVEDDGDLQQLNSRLLGTLGCEHREVTTAAAALAVVDDFQPDIIFVDLGLPDMDGQELLERLRCRRELARTPIVAVSGYPRWREQGPRLTTFDDYLVKPVPPATWKSLLAAEADKHRFLGRGIAV